MRNLLRLLLALWVAAASAAGDCDLDCSLATLSREESLTGTVYALVQGDEVRVGAVGLANHRTGERLRADAKVHIGSVTKTLLALGVLRLATQQRVDLDAPVAGLLPALPLQNPWEARSPVTLRHLLGHSAGLDDLRLWQIFTARADPRAPLVGAFSRPADLLRVRVEPGKRMSYSNMGFTLAAMVIEARTAERYEAWLDRELLRPLGMHDSTFEFVTQQGPDADARLAWGHHDDSSFAAAQAVWIRPAAQFTTTAADMARLAQFLMGDGRIADEVFVDPELLRTMGHARETEAAIAGLETGYALGLATRDRHGAVGQCHLGNIVGYRAAFCLYPRQRQAFFIAHNTDSESAKYGRLEERLVQELGVATPVTGKANASGPAPLAWEGRYVAAPSRFESFRLVDLLFDSVRLQVRGDDIELRRTGAVPARLSRVGTNLYREDGRTIASLALIEGDDGQLITDGLRTWRRIGGASFASHWLSLALGVTGFLALLFLIPWRAARRRETLLQPASAALALLLLPLPLLVAQPFTSIGDLTIASAALFMATVALPVLMAWHLAWAWLNRARLRSWPVHVAAAAFVLQFCVMSWAWDLLPLALWR